MGMLLMDNFVIRDLAQCGVNNLRFIVPMSRLRGGFLGITYRLSGDPLYITECTVDESRYKIEQGYKITLRARDPLFGTETFYQSDLESMIKDYHKGKTQNPYTFIVINPEA
jgi:hypothetical protein